MRWATARSSGGAAASSAGSPIPLGDRGLGLGTPLGGWGSLLIVEVTLLGTPAVPAIDDKTAQLSCVPPSSVTRSAIPHQAGRRSLFTC